MSNMHGGIYIARVTADGNRDLNERGFLKAELLNSPISQNEITAHATMAFGGTDCGIFGNVLPGTKILVTRVRVSDDSEDNSKLEWFWIGVVPEPYLKPKFSTVPPYLDIFTSTLPDARESYHTSDTPNHMIMKSPVGHKLVLADKVTRNSNKVISQEDYALLRTNTNKQIKLDAGVGPGHDKILISDEAGNKIVIKTGADEKPGKNSIKIECIGNLHITSHEGEIDLTVGKDSTKDISLTNRGSGNVHIRSNKGDVTVKANEDISLQSKNVKVEATKESIQVTSKLDVHVNCGRDLNVYADGNVKVISTDSSKSIKLDSAGAIDIEAATVLTLKAASIAMVKA